MRAWPVGSSLRLRNLSCVPALVASVRDSAHSVDVRTQKAVTVKIPGLPPADIGKTHVRILHAGFMHELESHGVPLRRYSEGTGIVWAERWACKFIDEWIEMGANDALAELLIRRIVNYVQRHPDQVDLAEAATTVARLHGRQAVVKMLDDLGDMVRQ